MVKQFRCSDCNCKMTFHEAKKNNKGELLCPSCFTRDIMANGPRKVEWEDIEENRYFTSMAKIAGYSRGLTGEEMALFATPDRDDTIITITGFGDVSNQTIFHTCQLMDTHQGAGELNTKKLTAALDPQHQARQMPGRNSGYSKHGKKPKCPVHRTTVTEYGTCPVCDKEVVVRFDNKGHTKAVFTSKEHPACDYYVKPDKVRLTRKVDGKRKLARYGKWDTEWLRPTEEVTYLGKTIKPASLVIGRLNFDGKVNKKSDGRCARTGSYPSPIDPKRMTKHRHNSGIRLDYNIKQVKDNDETIYYDETNTTINRVNPELRTCKECDCTFTLKDMRRGDVVCPKCGLMKGVVMMGSGGNRGGESDVDYGGN